MNLPNQEYKSLYTSQSQLEEIDVKKILFKILNIWPFIIGGVIFSLFTAFVYLKVSPPIYESFTTIQFKEAKSIFPEIEAPFQPHKKLNEVAESNKLILLSYPHNKEIIKQEKLFITYQDQSLKQEISDPNFDIEIDPSHYQVLSIPIKITFINETFRVELPIEQETIKLFNYQNDELIEKKAPINTIIQTGSPESWLTTDFFKIKITPKIKTNQIKEVKNGHSPTWITFSSYYSVYKSIKNKLKVNQVNEDLPVLEIQMTGKNPKQSSNYLNKTVALLEQNRAYNQNQNTENGISFIEKKIIDLQDSLAVVENKLKKSKSNEGLLDFNQQSNYLFTKYSDLESTETRITDQINQLKEINTQLASHLLDSAPNFTPIYTNSNIPLLHTQIVTLNSFLSEQNRLKASMLPGNPALDQVENAIVYEKNTLHDAISKNISLLQQDYENCVKEKNRLKSNFKQLPYSENLIEKVNRQHAVLEKNYTFLIHKLTEYQLLATENQSNIQVIEPASLNMSSVIAPKNKLTYLIALLMGFSIPIALKLITEFFENRVQSLEDITKYLETPIIGVIGHQIKSENLTGEINTSPLLESYRFLKKNCDDQIDSQLSKSKIISITSLLSGEGKSFTAYNLAKIYAESGARTILVSADLRHPDLYKHFEGCSQKNGLSTFLSLKNPNLQSLIQKTQYPNLNFLASGSKKDYSPHLISSQQFSSLIEDLKPLFETIIIDTPPIGLVSDAKYISSFCDINIHIIRHKKTPINLIENWRSSHLNRNLENNFLVINDVLESKYSYGHYYHYPNAIYNNYIY